MIYHVSIDADAPQHVAGVLAELMGGKAFPFPPILTGQSWVAMAGDDRNTTVEVYPRGTELMVADGDADSFGRIGASDRHSATHIALATHLDSDAVFAIAAREGWPAKYRKRGGIFGVIEFWIEGSRLVEVLTPEMQAEYLSGVTLTGWEKMIAAGGPRPLAAA